MTGDSLKNWLEAYGTAWESRNPEAAAALFAEDVIYQETPFGEPARGRAGVRTYWAAATTNQRDVRFSFEILSVSRHQGIAQWSAEFMRQHAGARVELDGVFVLRFDEQGLCQSLREWWHIAGG